MLLLRETSLGGLSTEVVKALGPDDVTERMSARRARNWAQDPLHPAQEELLSPRLEAGVGPE